MNVCSKTLLGLGALLALTLPATAMAQGDYSTSPNTNTNTTSVSSSAEPFIGLGVRLGTIAPLAAPTRLNVYVPINLMPILRIEPDLGFSRSASVNENFDDDGNSVLRQENKDSVFRLGVGAFYMMQPANRTNIYVGGRLGLLRNSSVQQVDAVVLGANVNTTTTTTRNDIMASLATGGEAYVTTHFSLGGEVALDFTSFGDPRVTTDPESNMDDDDDTSSSTTALSTSGALFLRWYFM